jgi:hypothetical protein
MGMVASIVGALSAGLSAAGTISNMTKGTPAAPSQPAAPAVPSSWNIAGGGGAGAGGGTGTGTEGGMPMGGTEAVLSGYGQGTGMGYGLSPGQSQQQAVSSTGTPNVFNSNINLP